MKKLLSVNIGKVRTVDWQGKQLQSAIFKSSVSGSLKVSFSGLEGDRQADQKHHGGEFKALYSYDQAYYKLWKTLIQRIDWPSGLFGENLSTIGLSDEEVCIGDVYQIGSVLIQASQPRIPCSKLNLRFERTDMLKLFLQTQRFGIYWKVLQEGSLQAGDSIELVKQAPKNLTVAEVAYCQTSKGSDQIKLQAALNSVYLPEEFKKYLRKFLK